MTEHFHAETRNPHFITGSLCLNLFPQKHKCGCFPRKRLSKIKSWAFVLFFNFKMHNNSKNLIIYFIKKKSVKGLYKTKGVNRKNNMISY